MVLCAGVWYLIELLTPRLRLRPWTAGDAPLLVRLASDAGAIRHIPNRPEATTEAADAKLATLVGHWREHGFGLWVAEDRLSGEFAGRAGLQFIPGIDPPEAEMGYIFREAFWGRGLASEAAAASLWFGFAHLGLDHIAALAVPENDGSVKVMRKLGMTCTGEGTWYGTRMVRHEIRRADWTPPAMAITLRKLREGEVAPETRERRSLGFRLSEIARILGEEWNAAGECEEYAYDVYKLLRDHAETDIVAQQLKSIRTRKFGQQQPPDEARDRALAERLRCAARDED